MRKFFATLAVVAMMAFSAVPAFSVQAAELDSPVATTPVSPGSGTPVSPKTGSSDIAIYSLIAGSLAVCGAASFVLVNKTKAKK